MYGSLSMLCYSPAELLYIYQTIVFSIRNWLPDEELYNNIASTVGYAQIESSFKIL